MTARAAESSSRALRAEHDELAELLSSTGLTEIEIEKKGMRLRVARSLTVSAMVPAAGTTSAPNAPPTLRPIIECLAYPSVPSPTLLV